MCSVQIGHEWLFRLAKIRSVAGEVLPSPSSLVSTLGRLHPDFHLREDFQSASTFFCPSASKKMSAADPIFFHGFPLEGLLQKAEELVLKLLCDKKTSELKLAVIPSLATEVTAAYTSACVLLKSTPEDEQTSLASDFTACHVAARSSLEAICAEEDAVTLCKEEM